MTTQQTATPRPQIFAAATTPFTAAGELDLAAAREIFAFLDASGVDGVFVAGTTGEFVTLDHRERVALFEVALQTCRRARAFLHVGAASTHAACRLARDATSLGAAHLAAVTPYYHPADADALYGYFAAVADAAGSAELYAYTIPSCAPNAVTAALLTRLARIDNITGAKLSLDTRSAYADRLAAQSGLTLLAGNDALGAEVLRMGAHGLVSGPAAAAPEPYLALAAALADTRDPEVDAAQRQIAELARVVGGNPNRIKAAQAVRGLPAGHHRAVLPPISAADTRHIEDVLHQIVGVATTPG